MSPWTIQIARPAHEVADRPSADHCATSPAPEPDVSFVVAAHNAAGFIEKAIMSAMSQSGVSLEIVVVDDASTDGTADLVDALARRDPRITCLRQPTNGGPSRARNRAFQHARGTWLAILDADDTILSDRSRRLIDLAAATGADIVADNFERVGVDGRSLGSTMIPTAPSGYALAVALADFVEANVAFERKRYTLGAVKPMLRREFLQQRRLQYRDELAYGEDYQFLVECLEHGARFIVTSHVGYRYCIREGSQSWRLGLDHVEQMLRTHRDTRLIERFRSNEAVASAARRYQRGLENARGFLTIVDAAKRRRIGEAAWRSLASPNLWPLLVRFGTEAIGRRLRSRCAP